MVYRVLLFTYERPRHPNNSIVRLLPTLVLTVLLS